MERESGKKLYEIEVVDEDSVQEMVKVHYKGYDSKYDEWKPKNEVVLCPPPQKLVDSSSPFEALVKKKLVPSNEDPSVRIQLPFDLESWRILLEVSKRDGEREHTITQYSDLDDLMGEDWHYRVYNTRGDFAYAMLETIQFHLFHPKPILEYSVTLDQGKKLHYTPTYTMQGPQLVCTP